LTAGSGRPAWQRELTGKPLGVATDPDIGVAYVADNPDAVYAFRV
jgi:hypothetical protein